jgi:hypothetical protein
MSNSIVLTDHFNTSYPSDELMLSCYREVIVNGQEAYNLPQLPIENLVLIVVSQGTTDAPLYLKALSEIVPIGALVLKNSKKIHPYVVERLKKEYDTPQKKVVFDEITSEDLEDSDFAFEFLREAAQGYQQVLIVDHSAYFPSGVNLKCRQNGINLIGRVDGSTEGYVKNAVQKSAQGVPYMNHWNSIIKYEENNCIAIDFVRGLHAVFNELGVRFEFLNNKAVLGLGGTGLPLLNCFGILDDIFHDRDNCLYGCDTIFTRTKEMEPYARWRLQPPTHSPYRFLPYSRKNIEMIRDDCQLIASCTGNKNRRPLNQENLRSFNNRFFWAGMSNVNRELGLDELVKRGTLKEAPEGSQFSQKKVAGTDVRYVTTYQPARGKGLIHVILKMPVNYLLEKQHPYIALTHAAKILSVLKLIAFNKKTLGKRYTLFDELGVMEMGLIFKGMARLGIWDRPDILRQNLLFNSPLSYRDHNFINEEAKSFRYE